MSEAELRLHRCCFTGHRPEKLRMDEQTVRRMLEGAIRQAAADGFVTYISGMAKGVDVIAGEIVLELRRSDPKIRLVCAMPFKGFGQHWQGGWTERQRTLLEQADLVRYVCDGYSRSAYQIRNQWMVDHASRVIAIFNGEPGGTKNTIDYAAKKGVPCIILSPKG